MSNIDGIEDAYCIVRVNVADESGIHQELVIGSCPVLECDVHCPRTEVASADTDLNDCSELLACSVGYLAGVDLCCEVSDSGLLACVEVSLVDAIPDDV